jgi:hypothetical protein
MRSEHGQVIATGPPSGKPLWQTAGFDRAINAHLHPRMLRLRLIAAWMVALMWLPASLHCGLEAAGVIGQADPCCHHDTSAGDATEPCGLSVCGIVESGDYQPAQNPLKFFAPSVVLFVFSPIVSVPTLTSVSSETCASEHTESPPEIRRTWHFVARAAPAPRAPAALS